MVPSTGRIVHYRLSRQDAQAANLRKAHARRHQREHREDATGVVVHTGNDHQAGDTVPLLVVRVWADEYTASSKVCRDSVVGQDYDTIDWVTPKSVYGINGQAFLDGNDTLWVTSAPQAEANGCWDWPERS